MATKCAIVHVIIVSVYIIFLSRNNAWVNLGAADLKKAMLPTIYSLSMKVFLIAIENQLR